MRAAELKDSPRSFCKAFLKEYAKEPVRFEGELLFRLFSIASWMEAQESFSLWLAMRFCRAAWNSEDEDERARSITACILARPKLASVSQGLGLTRNKDLWASKQWKNILKHAATLATKPDDCAQLEKWVWWCFPVFQRLKWNARQVIDAAVKRGITFENEKLYELKKFQKYWIRRGLRFAGGKQKRVPLLAEFIQNISLPETADVRGVPIWELA
jgi:hypothetical protein